LLLLIGAWCSRHRASRLRHRKRSKNFVGFTGVPFIAFCGDRYRTGRGRGISPSVFLPLLMELRFGLSCVLKLDNMTANRPVRGLHERVDRSCRSKNCFNDQHSNPIQHRAIISRAKCDGTGGFGFQLLKNSIQLARYLRCPLSRLFRRAYNRDAPGAVADFDATQFFT